MKNPTRSTVMTTLVIGVMAYFVATAGHEGVGHGGACLIVGGKALRMSSAWFDCDKQGLSEWAVRAIKAGGTVANLLLGAFFLATMPRAPGRPSNRWYAHWLLAATNLFMGAGYLMTSPFGNHGDWADFIAGLSRPLAWRIALTLTGAILSAAALRVLLRRLDPHLGTELPERATAARILCWVPYGAVGGVLFSIAALMNAEGMQYVVSSALATLGGTFFLAWLPAWVKAPRGEVGPPLELAPTPAWLTAGAAITALTLGVLGPGIRF
ncbi:hypothetical protein [Polyangium jinanense]|uniref:Uncharacterized protein n=1 Tax=Polyangium jinanense TaxID=2829994 RepID=A0A9X3XHS6_9BACT|nr:hypothetical protein [Polyangium jinanense]MDC3959748.1 hypothetical protein [Polyangium jinanense]MDC3988923.1 hypothetical protein [Polyangium jinanense]